MTEPVQGTPYGKPIENKNISLCVAGMAHVILASSTTQTREMGQELIMDLLVGYGSGTRKNDPRSAEEVREDLKANGYAKFQALYDALPHGKDAAFDNTPERRTVQSIMGLLSAVGAIEHPTQQKKKETDMSDVLNSDQRQLVKESIRDLNRVQMRTADEVVKGQTQDLIWDLTLLAIPESRSPDSRSLEDVKEDLRVNGSARLAAIGDAVDDAGKACLASASALLSVAKLIEAAPGKNASQWRDRVAQPKSTGRQI